MTTSKLKKAFGKLRSGVMNDEEITLAQKKEWGLYLAILAFVFGSLWLTSWHERFFFDEGKFKFNFPGAVNGTLGFFLCMPMYVRGFIEFKHISVYRCVSFLFNWLLCASVMQIIFGPDNTFIKSFSNIFLFSGLLLTWLGIRAIAGLCWLLFIVAAIINLSFSNKFPQLSSFLFLACGFFSLMFQMNLVPSEIYKLFKEEFINLDSRISNSIKGDIIASSENITRAVNK